jgi:signal transduction histidine kinase/sensor domain CHASE-containing protein
MRLRNKTLLIISATTFGLTLVLYIIVQNVVLGRFTRLENQFAQQNADRVLRALSDEVAALDVVARGWAMRDETAAFIRAPSREYVQSSLDDAAFISSGLNLVSFVSPSGEFVYSKAFDLQNEKQVAVPQGLQRYLSEGSPLLHHTSPESSVTGIVLLQRFPLLVASRPIPASGTGEEAFGALIVGRYLDLPEIEHLAELSGFSLTLHRIYGPEMPVDFQAVLSSLSKREPVYVQPMGIESISAYVLLEDVYGEPLLLLRVDMPREIYGQGLASVRYFMLLLMSTSLVFGLMTLLLLERVVLSPLTRLSVDVSEVSVSGNLSTRMSVSGKDELADLGQGINRMLTTLERAQNSLRRRNRELTTLYEATTAISSNLSLEPVLLTVAEEMTGTLDATGCTLSLWNREENRVETLVDYSTMWPTDVEASGCLYDLDDYPMTRHVLETGEAVLIQHDDPMADPTELALMEQWEAFTLLMLPLVVRDRVVGLVELIDDVKKHPYTSDDIRLAESLATQAAVAIENARLYEQAQQEIAERKRVEERLATVYVLGRELVLTRDEKTITQIAVDAAGLLLQCRLCALWLVDEEEKSLDRQTVRTVGPIADVSSSSLSLKNEQHIAVATARSREPTRSSNLQEGQQVVDKGCVIRSELSVPLEAGGMVIGVLTAGSDQPDAFDEEDEQLFLTLADQTALAIENARLYETAEQQQEHLRALATRLAEAEEIERRRLAQELHDQVGQNLTALGINLNIVQSLVPEGTVDVVRGRLDDSLSLLKQTTQRIRDVMADLQPPVLEDYGLMTALRWYCAQFTSRAGIPVDVQGDDLTPRLSHPVESVLFRIAQEALTNVAKYAQATRATVTVTEDEGVVRLVVVDDGLGFDPVRTAGPDERQSWGLLTMAERTEAVGGRLWIDSDPEQGTQVVVEVAR